MAGSFETLTEKTGFTPETGALVEVAPGIARVTAPNSGPYTFTGTNSFLVGKNRVVLIDPGPRNRGHLKALLAAIGERKLEAILLTHTHKDHSALAPRLRKLTGAPIWFAGAHTLSRPARRFERNPIASASDWRLVPDQTLADGATIIVDGLALSVIATPGHCANHLAFALRGTPFLLTGDHIMGWSSTLVAPPDGSMADYLASLEKTIVAPFSHYLPAHGGPIPDGRRYARALLAHRQERNRQILAAVGERALGIGQLLARIYPEIAPELRMAARMTLHAHIEYLEDRGEVTVRRGPFGARIKSRE